MMFGLTWFGIDATRVIPTLSAFIGLWYENEKHKSVSLSAIQVRDRQKKISIEVKLDVICQLEEGEWIVDKCLNVSFA